MLILFLTLLLRRFLAQGLLWLTIMTSHTVTALIWLKHTTAVNKTGRSRRCWPSDVRSQSEKNGAAVVLRAFFLTGLSRGSGVFPDAAALECIFLSHTALVLKYEFL
jgi:hypothetical protein